MKIDKHTVGFFRRRTWYWVILVSFRFICVLWFMRKCICINGNLSNHDDVIKWKHFPRYWPFVRGIHRSPVNSPHKGQWRGALMFSLTCVWINISVNNREAGDMRRHRVHYDVIAMLEKWGPRLWEIEAVADHTHLNYSDPHPAPQEHTRNTRSNLENNIQWHFDKKLWIYFNK